MVYRAEKVFCNAVGKNTFIPQSAFPYPGVQGVNSDL